MVFCVLLLRSRNSTVFYSSRGGRSCVVFLFLPAYTFSISRTNLQLCLFVCFVLPVL